MTRALSSSQTFFAQHLPTSSRHVHYYSSHILVALQDVSSAAMIAEMTLDKVSARAKIEVSSSKRKRHASLQR